MRYFIGMLFIALLLAGCAAGNGEPIKVEFFPQIEQKGTTGSTRVGGATSSSRNQGIGLIFDIPGIIVSIFEDDKKKTINEPPHH